MSATVRRNNTLRRYERICQFINSKYQERADRYRHLRTHINIRYDDILQDAAVEFDLSFNTIYKIYRNRPEGGYLQQQTA
ncbi:hypothetical protein V6R21_11665 [Limibacter armeniacum]|uniref:hypothetical protein n=1 Tax=Limibacter armeniacum TaxID=466084 RepID=UPI002FE5FA26